VNQLDQLISLLEKTAAAQDAVAVSAPADAISAELSRPRRTTAVQALRDSTEMAAFRQEYQDGLIRVDTLNRALTLVSQVIGLITAGQ
jgi:hypothetical protein